MTGGRQGSLGEGVRLTAGSGERTGEKRHISGSGHRVSMAVRITAPKAVTPNLQNL